jgi:tetratricopeptide (TPR) repeat protein
VAEHLDQGLRKHTKLVTSGWPRPPVDELIEPSDSTDPTASLIAERGALVAAVHACADLGWSDLAWDLGLTLQRFLESHHHFDDWSEVATAALSAARSSDDRHAESAALCSLGELHEVQDQYAAATQAYQQALTIARDGGYDRVGARALLGLSGTHTAIGQLDDATRFAGEALSLVDDSLDPGTAAEAWMSLGRTQHRQGDAAAGNVSYRRALDGFVATGDRLNEAILLVNMGTALGVSERWEEAEHAFNQSVDICREIGFRNGEGFAHTALGSMLRRKGEAGRAEQALTAALDIVRDYADQFTEGLILNNLGELLRPIDLDRSRRYFTEAVELLRDGELPALLADALIGLGDTDLLSGEPTRAHAAWLRAEGVVDPSDTDRAAEIRRRLAG